MSQLSLARTVTPGIDRLGDDVVNFYLVRHTAGLLLVDAGLPSHLKQLREHLATIGHALSDISAVLLTHTHPDHTGLAAPCTKLAPRSGPTGRTRRPLTDGPRIAMRHAKPERAMAPYLLRRPPPSPLPCTWHASEASLRHRSQMPAPSMGTTPSTSSPAALRL
ncbi:MULTISPECIES: MBL fold metallo-hydrolase [unclassified Streptomyces]|uniref:MBL fold metallo-hydrolase n=1 Tax=unclassified Streptomyces TaxID=2593676 RepID=UPI002E198FFC|nr:MULTISPECIES: MBL fold metallo-hydrolase [unclassified Streptomyces]